ncbi:MAG: transcriptional regulator [Thiotrichales bacterium]|nr:MAG: transcriptional regulator [Thiotrichales bacterium]
MSTKSKVTKKTEKKLQRITGIPLTLGNFLWSISKCDEMTQAEFAEKQGISKQYLCDLERGRRLVSPKMAAGYAKLLGYSYEQFVRLSLQDMVDRDGINFIIEVTPRKGDMQPFCA